VNANEIVNELGIEDTFGLMVQLAVAPIPGAANS
jgi:hypothetical protein